ncbi:hypothetical protein DFH09DRAFT_1353052 [Mycena vulgaris]|nr:hypothetical protein DFH09DRAFT_1353052 [Mycena vulgaris]
MRGHIPPNAPAASHPPHPARRISATTCAASHSHAVSRPMRPPPHPVARHIPPSARTPYPVWGGHRIPNVPSWAYAHPVRRILIRGGHRIPPNVRAVSCQCARHIPRAASQPPHVLNPAHVPYPTQRARHMPRAVSHPTRLPYPAQRARRIPHVAGIVSCQRAHRILFPAQQARHIPLNAPAVSRPAQRTRRIPPNAGAGVEWKISFPWVPGNRRYSRNYQVFGFSK